MKFKDTGITILLFITLIVISCSNMNENSVTIEGTTKFTSTSLTTVSPRLSSQSLHTTVGNDTLITPTNVHGQAMALLYGFGTGQGLDIFGPQRPDLAGPDTTLVSFNMSEQLSIASTVFLKDDFPGGNTEILVLSFGYLDLDFTLSGTLLSTDNHVIRVAMGSVKGMTRGDVLMKINGEFNWYDTDTSSFTTTRPTNPIHIDDVADFVDATAPQRHFYSFNVQLSDGGITVSTDELKASSGILNTVDFHMGSLITIKNITDVDTLTDAQLIQKFSLERILVDGVGDGLTASSNIEVL